MMMMTKMVMASVLCPSQFLSILQEKSRDLGEAVSTNSLSFAYFGASGVRTFFLLKKQNKTRRSITTCFLTRLGWHDRCLSVRERSQMAAVYGLSLISAIVPGVKTEPSFAARK